MPERFARVDEGGPPAGRRGGPVRPRHKVPATILSQLEREVGERRSATLGRRLGDAIKAFEGDRFGEARRLLVPLAEAAPGASAVRELLGLTLYRLGQWRAAARELEAYADLTGSTTQHPVIADCYRALKRHKRVAELWEDLREASPDAATVAEGRIVLAGSLADRGELAEAIQLLSAARVRNADPKAHHLRVWYALADLYERAGEVPRAREIFERIARHDPDFVDVRDRIRGLR